MIPEKFADLFTKEKKAFAFLALVKKDGTPQVTPLWFDYDGTHIIINTARGRVKDKILKRHPARRAGDSRPGERVPLHSDSRQGGGRNRSGRVRSDLRARGKISRQARISQESGRSARDVQDSAGEDEYDGVKQILFHEEHEGTRRKKEGRFVDNFAF